MAGMGVWSATARRRRLFQYGLGVTATAAFARAGGLAPRTAAAQLADPDTQMAEVLDALMALGLMPIEDLVPRQAREQPSFRDAVMLARARRGQPPAVEQVRDIDHRVVPGGPGSEGTLVRIYTPAGGAPPYPVIVYFHGGGWVIANLNVYDPSARTLANAAGAIVVSVAYRQAPEHPFPAAVDDAYTAYSWVLANAERFGGDPNRVAVAGESAGGNLAAVTSLLARDRGLPLPAHQLLVYPVTDLVNAADYQSAQDNTNAMPLSLPGLVWFGSYYLPDPDLGRLPTASPLLAASHAGLPSATIITAELDPLRGQGFAYADVLRTAGVPVDHRDYLGVTHEFFGASAFLDKARDAVAFAAANLQSSFGAPATRGGGRG